ncbi:hypothetical protein niasHT_026413 [Heterodera trifolii]|uniref:Uncharacterized protein n=1 Tax=Heterodera trifolii TaxID=157864 RepID=A0ABD2JBP2_9BILA
MAPNRRNLLVRMQNVQNQVRALLAEVKILRRQQRAAGNRWAQPRIDFNLALAAHLLFGTPAPSLLSVPPRQGGRTEDGPYDGAASF